MKEPFLMLNKEIYNHLRNLILAGELKAGEKLPIEIELARKMNISRGTLRSALKQLEKEKLIRRIPREGTFVTGENNSHPTILYVSDSLENAAFHESSPNLLPGVLKRCKELGIICEAVTFNELSHIALDGRWKGIILGDSIRKKCLCTKLKESGLPVVLVGVPLSDPMIGQFAAILTDKHQAWLDGLTHLKRRGCRRIAFLLSKNYETVKARMGVEPEDFESPRELIQFAPDFLNVEEAMEKLLALPEKPDAIYCYADSFAISAYTVLHSRHIAIPEAIAVMGFSGCSAGHLLNPALSTVDFDLAGMGVAAVDLLQKGWGEEIPLIYYPHEVVMRSSTNIFRYNLSNGK